MDRLWNWWIGNWIEFDEKCILHNIYLKLPSSSFSSISNIPSIPKQPEAPGMPLVIYDGQTTSFVAKIRSWNQLNRNQLMNSEHLTFWKTLLTVEWVQTWKFNWRIPAPCMPWKSAKFLQHCTRGHRLGKVLVEFQDQANDSIFDTCKVTHCEIWDQLIAFPLWPLAFQICSSARVWRTTCKVVMAHSKDTKETRQVWLPRYILSSRVW